MLVSENERARAHTNFLSHMTAQSSLYLVKCFMTDRQTPKPINDIEQEDLTIGYGHMVSSSRAIR